MCSPETGLREPPCLGVPRRAVRDVGTGLVLPGHVCRLDQHRCADRRGRSRRSGDFGIATGDDVPPGRLCGFALALGGVALASFEQDPTGAARLAAGVPWAIAAVVGFGGYYVPMHQASEQDFLWAALRVPEHGRPAGHAPLGSSSGLRSPRRAGSLGTIALIGLMDTAGNTLFAAASSLGEVSVVSVLATLYPVTTVALAALVLSERVSRLQGLGVVAALVGVALISAG